MKKGWQERTLGELCSFENGDRGENYPSKSVQTTSGVPFINAGHLAESGIDFSGMNYIPRERFDLLGNGKIQKDDILFCLRGSLGKFASVGDLNEGAIASSLVIIRPSEAILNEFVLAYLQSDLCAEMIREFRNGAAQPNLAAASLKKFIIPVPPVPEQQRIVGILDEAFEGIATAKANAEKNLQNARAPFESHLQSVFTQRGKGWVEKPLSELCDIKHGFAFKSEFFSDGGDYVLLTPGNFYESGGYRDRGEKQKYYSGEIPREYVLSEGDLLVAMTEQAAGLLGSPILVPESDKFLHNQRLGLITKKPGVPWTNEFFFHVFNTQAVRKEIHDSASGVKVRHTSPTKIGEVVVSFPSSLSEQSAIVSTLKELREETQRLTFVYDRKRGALEALKKSLLHQAFTGAL
jgi:type I restriction enzyme, S subunit